MRRPPARHSAGILVHRARTHGPEVLLVHPGGPFWAARDDGAWSIPKGECEPDEDPLHAAYREFAEELGRPAPTGPARPLGEVRQRGGKLVTAWAVELAAGDDLDVTAITSSTFDLEWPPRSGVVRRFPEVDRAEWFGVPAARAKLLAAQAEFLDRLLSALDGSGEG